METRDNETALPELMLTSEAARLLQVSTGTLRAWEFAGRLVPARVGGRNGMRVYVRAAVERVAADRNARIASEGSARRVSVALQHRITTLLRVEGPLPSRVIAERLRAAEGPVRVALSRGKKIGRFHRLPSADGPARWGAAHV